MEPAMLVSRSSRRGGSGSSFPSPPVKLSYNFRMETFKVVKLGDQPMRGVVSMCRVFNAALEKMDDEKNVLVDDTSTVTFSPVGNVWEPFKRS